MRSTEDTVIWRWVRPRDSLRGVPTNFKWVASFGVSYEENGPAMASTPARHDRATVILHWLLAAVVTSSLVLGFVVSHGVDPAERSGLLLLHIDLGISTLVISGIRAFWWWRGKRELESASPPGWQRATQRVIYALLTLLPLGLAVSGTGMLMTSGIAGSASGVGSIEGPHEGHLIAALLMIALAGVHISAVMYHQLKLREPVVARMVLDRSAAKPQSTA